MTTLNSLAQGIYEVTKSKGFWDKERNVGEMLMLITSELGEAMEAHRKNKFAKSDDFFYDLESHLPISHPNHSIEDFKSSFEKNIKDTFEDEIADAIIRLLDLCAGLGIDIDFQIKQKLKYNQTRQKFHGKAY